MEYDAERAFVTVLPDPRPLRRTGVRHQLVKVCRVRRNFAPTVHGYVAALPVRFEPAEEGDVRLEGVVVTCTDDGKARGIETIRIPA